jgi:hypothetical protein
MLEHALAAVAAGIPVFPLLPGEKNPDAELAPRGWQSATLDTQQVRAWWTVRPTANVGGAVGLAGLTVIDLDMKGANGALSLLDWELAREVQIERPVVVRTASGGHHIYLRGTTRNRASILPGVDVRGEGGYVVLPGSIVNGVRYAFVEGGWHTPLPEAPSAWVAEVGKPPTKAENPMAWLVEADLPENIQRAQTWLRREVERGKVAVEGQGGDLWTVKTAAMLRDFGVSEETALDLLDAEWNPHCEPPWEREDLARKVANAYRYAQKPGGIKAAAAMQLEARLGAKARERSRQRFTPLSWEDVQNLPDPRWLLPGTLPESGVSMIYGPQASFKSFLALSVALDVATGLNTTGLAAEGQDRPEPRHVLYIVGEGAFGIRKRVEAWWKANGQPSMQNFRLVASMPALADETEFDEFVCTVADAGVRPALVVVDTVARAMYGFDENSALDMGRMIKNADAMKEGWNCNVLLIHHAAKTGAARGSGALPAAVDTELRVSAKKKRLTVSMTKQKDAEQWEEPRQFEMVAVAESIVPRPANRIEPTDEASKAEVTDVFDKVVEQSERERRAKDDAELVEIIMGHLDMMQDIPEALPVSVSALAAQVAAETGRNREYLREFLRRKVPGLNARVAERDPKGRPSFYI